MPYDPSRALELLRLGTRNQRATFRNGQEDAIQHVVEGKGRLLVVEKTGWGKSSLRLFHCDQAAPRIGHGARAFDLTLTFLDAEPDRGGRADGGSVGDDSFRQYRQVG